MSAGDHLSQQQFANSLHEVPLTPSSRLGTDRASVRYVPTHLLHDAYSAEYDVPAHQMAAARSERIQKYGIEHDGDHPGAQEALEQSVAQHGVKEPLVLTYQPPNSLDEKDGSWSINNGSHRLLAAMRTGQPHVPVVQRF